MMLLAMLARHALMMLLMWLISVFLMEVDAIGPREEFGDYWIRAGQKRLHSEIKRQQETVKLREKVAKNVILFIGDGMGMSTITASRIYKNQLAGGYGEENGHSFEDFPFVGLSKTYEVNIQVPDSAGTATAMFTGAKINANMTGFDGRAKYDECDPSINEKAKLETLATWAQAAGKDTGFVSTTRVTHATPAAMYAQTNSRYWECDSRVPTRCKNVVKDIARQLVEDEPGRNLKVILGGGMNQLGVPATQKDEIFCTRDDKQNLAEKWKQGRKNHLFVSTKQGLMNADLNKVEYLMGLFSPGNMPFALERDNSPAGQPSLLNMTVQALKLLSRNPKGYLLLVEGGNVDNAHHGGYVRHALHEAKELDDAVAHAVKVTNPDDTLIIVTADHSHTLTIGGYPERGSDILGFTTSPEELRGHDILTYANGPGFESHMSYDCSEGYWREVTEEDRKNLRYHPFAGRHADKETHGGEDVPLYARGPQANLLSGVYEQNYIAHVISYAACIGPHATFCDFNRHPKFHDAITNSAGQFSSTGLYFFAVVLPLLPHIMFSVTQVL